MSPIASILVTSFNHARYLNSCLNSIKSSISNKIELFIIDDASADISKEVIDHWVKNNRSKYLSVKTIFNKKNAGISQCFSEFTYAAKADILLPLASDDMYILETVDERVRFLTNNPDIWVGFSDARAINTDGNVINQSLYKYYKHQFADCSYEVLKKELILNWNYPANIQFWRKGDWIHEISPGMFSEDIEIALAALAKNKVKYLNKVLYLYRCATWPIEAKGCEKSKRLHMSYYYRKAASQSAGMTKYALLKLSEYNLSIAVNDITQARKLEKKIHFIKKLPSALFR
jgi:glycosyltransferase involved in cell wall biosynthesis